MTGSELTRIERLDFDGSSISKWRDRRGRHDNWPVVYVLDDQKRVYVGESTRARGRLREHLQDPQRKSLQTARILIDERFNKSACLDLESRLISWFHADAQFEPINRNDGQQNSNYFERESRYQHIFEAVFDRFRAQGLFKRSISEIENLSLFKLSPFKALNDEQAHAVNEILEGLISDVETDRRSTAVVEGGPGTGKTIVAIFLLKLIRDIQRARPDIDPFETGQFSDFFLEGFREPLADLRIGFVVPQQSLRKTVKNVFKRTQGLREVSVLGPYEVAGSSEPWDLLVVDETHRLTHRGSGTLRGLFKKRQLQLFGEGAGDRTAIDWILARSKHQVFLLDGEQSVRPADVPLTAISGLRDAASAQGRRYALDSQMRVAAGEGYLKFASALLTDEVEPATPSETYDLRFFDDLGEMRAALIEKERVYGLARLVAGFAWPWASKGKTGDQAPFDIELDGCKLRWNRTAIDWVASDGSEHEVGSVHTVQGYDLNYAGVIVGPDIVWDEEQHRVRPVREHHYDSEVGRVRDEEELLRYIQSAYYVLLTRGMRGTYIYVCDPALRERVRRALPIA